MTIQAVIFDLGGVLVRTEDRTPRAELAEQLNMTYAELDRIAFRGESAQRAALGIISEEEHWENLGRLLGIPDERLDWARSKFWGGDQVDEELVNYIRALRGPYKTALLSNAWSSLRHYVTQVWEIGDAFDELIISAEVHTVKPEAAIYEITLQRLQIEPQQAVFVDDFAQNVTGAKAVGMHAIQFRNPDQVEADLAQLL
ncbi:MAG: HAD family phosphatase [Anaerolineales bacterium]|jgi:HAD superfamily hydrolase (TIGR01509 family)